MLRCSAALIEVLTIEVIVPIVSTLLLLSNVLIVVYKPIEVIVIPMIKNAVYNLLIFLFIIIYLFIYYCIFVFYYTITIYYTSYSS